MHTVTGKAETHPAHLGMVVLVHGNIALDACRQHTRTELGGHIGAKSCFHILAPSRDIVIELLQTLAVLDALELLGLATVKLEGDARTHIAATHSCRNLNACRASQLLQLLETAVTHGALRLDPVSYGEAVERGTLPVHRKYELSGL